MPRDPRDRTAADDDTPIRSRPPARKLPPWLITLCVVGPLVLIGGGIGIVMEIVKKGSATVGGVQLRNPAADAAAVASKGRDWNHRELFEYLKSRGVEFTYNDHVLGEDTTRSMWSLENTHRVMGLKGTDLNLEPLRITVVQYDNEQQAKNNCGNDSKSFYWGKFVFSWIFSDDTPSARLALSVAKVLNVNPPKSLR